jgi:hypothetical protein
MVRRQPQVVVVNQAPTRLERKMSRAEAEAIQREAEERRKVLRANGMRARLGAHSLPWRVALLVAALAGSTWLVEWLVDRLTAVTVAAIISTGMAWAGWMIGRRTIKWRHQVHIAAAVAVLWLLWASAAGPSWSAALWWIVGVLVSSTRWWKANRIPHPLAPNRDPVPVPVIESVPVLWDRNIAAKGRVLPGSWLSDRDTSKRNCETYTVNLSPGDQTITQALGLLERISSGLLVPIKRLVLEPHPNGMPTQMLLTVVQESPIDQTMPYQGARIAGERRHLIEIGPYGDGDGFAKWRMWQPGEEPMTGSWLSGFCVAGTGMGKSRLMELLAAGYMASNVAIVWFADPQGGASSPALKEYADWYVDGEGTDKMLTALELIAQAREKENSVRGWTRFDPSPERPGIVVFLDECHETFGRRAKRWATLLRKAQKLGISVVGLTQGASLDSLGGEDQIRSSLLPNLIAMRTNSKQTQHLIAGLTVDPETLPKIPGFGYTIGSDANTRTAPFRSEYLADPRHWFERYPMPKLDPLSANATGDLYKMRRVDAEQLAQANADWVEQMSAGNVRVADEPDLDDWGDDEPRSGAFQVPVFPSSPVQSAGEKPARDRVLVAVAQGITRTKEIGDAVGLGKTQLHDTLKALLESKELEQPTRGVYQLAGAATPPER